MMNWYGGGWGWAGVAGMGVMVVFWAAVIGVAVWAIARATRNEHVPGGAGPSARSVLDQRFAAGDIDVEEYARRRRALEAPISGDVAHP